jgi:hypothetical protein
MDDLRELQQKSAAAYAALLKESSGLIEELRDNQLLKPFRDEYVLLNQALRKSHDNERRLIKKSRELAQETQIYEQRVGWEMIYLLNYNC